MNDKNTPGALIEKLDINGQCQPSKDPKMNGKINHFTGYRKKEDYKKMYTTGPVTPVDKDGNPIISNPSDIKELGSHIEEEITNFHEENCVFFE